MTGFYSIGVYEMTQQYGGPEEGGWWWDSGEIVRDLPQLTCPDKEAAYRMAREMNVLLAIFVNSQRPSYSSAISQGKRVARVFDGHAPTYFPQERPHYE